MVCVVFHVNECRVSFVSDIVINARHASVVFHGLLIRSYWIRRFKRQAMGGAMFDELACAAFVTGCRCRGFTAFAAVSAATGNLGCYYEKH